MIRMKVKILTASYIQSFNSENFVAVGLSNNRKWNSTYDSFIVIG